MKQYTITEVQITPIKPKDGLIGFASIVFDNALYLSSIGIHLKLNGGFRLTYPSKIVGNRNVHTYHPINKQLSEKIEAVIFLKFKDVMKKAGNQANGFEFV